MAGVNITKAVVDRLQPGDSPVWDSKVLGFGVRCQTSAKTYFLKTRIRGQQRWITIGRHGSPWTPERARARAKVLLGQIADGGDPATERDADSAAGTFAKFSARYMAEYAVPHKKPRSAEVDRTNLDLNILPALGRRHLTDITRADIAKLQHSLKHKPGAANRCLSLLSHMFNKAEEWGVRPEGSNPVRRIQRYPERKIERFLSSAELGRLGEVLKRAETERITPTKGRGLKPLPEGGESPYLIAAIRLLAFTGARKSEILTAKWDYLDREHNALRLPDSKTGAKSIALGAPALAVLESLSRMAGNPYILPGLTRAQRPIIPDKFWRAVCHAANVKDCRIHDLRHSFASVGAAAGDSLILIGKLLGHSQPSTTARYAHLGDNPVLAAADRISGSIAASMGGGSAAKVIALKPARHRKVRGS
jgi:integrase